MHTIWQSFLQEHHAIIEKDHVMHFTNSVIELKSAQNQTLLVDLSNLGLIRISGKDALSFLQGQLTCDLKKVTGDKAQYGSYCTPKGRILANFIIWSNKDNDEYFMQLPSDLCESISSRLRIYILRAKVNLDNDTNNLIRLGIAGNHAKNIIEEIYHGSALPSSSLEILNTESGSILCRDINRYEIITTLEQAISMWPRLAARAIPVGTQYWDWLEIKAGIPVILPATQDQFIPQMVNLDVIGGVSFQKGCYPGQEIVARTQYLGKLKRRMYLANIDSSQQVMAGDHLFSNELSEQSCGMLVNATVSPEGGYDVLAVIQTSNAETGKIYWKSLNGPALRMLPLPYHLPQ